MAMTMTNEPKKPTKPAAIPAMTDKTPCEAPGLGKRIPSLVSTNPDTS